MAMSSNLLTGSFELGEINAIDEGLPTLWCTYFFTAIFGRGIWEMEIFGITMSTIFLTFLLITATA